MRVERGASGEVGPLKATVAPPATEQEQEVMRPPSEIKWAEVGMRTVHHHTAKLVAVVGVGTCVHMQTRGHLPTLQKESIFSRRCR